MGISHAINPKSPFPQSSVYGRYRYDPRANLCCSHSEQLLMLFGSLDFIVAIVFFALIAFLQHTDVFVVEALPKFDFASLAIPATLISLVVTFYNNFCFTRYWEALVLTQHMKGGLCDLVIYMCAFFDGDSADHAEMRWEGTRFVNIMHHRFYALVMEDGSENSCFDLDECPQITLPSGISTGGGATLLATADEVAKLRRMPLGSQYLIVTKWLMTKFKRAGDAELISPLHLKTIEGKLQEIREDMGKVLTQVSRPLPLPYYYVVVFLSRIMFFAYAYAAAQTDVRVSWVPLLLFVCGMVGLLSVSRELAMPFGQDAVDLQCRDYWEEAVQKTFEILAEEDIGNVMEESSKDDDDDRCCTPLLTKA